MPEAAPDILRILFAGDLAFFKPVTSPICGAEIVDVFKKAPYRVANFEVPVVAKDDQPILKAGPAIFQQEGLNYTLDTGLFNIFTLANNHIMDYGKNGLIRTLDFLRARNCKTFGAGLSFEDAYRPLIIREGNISVALFGISEAQFGCMKDDYAEAGYAWAFSHEVVRVIERVKKEVDFTIILPHGGLEMCDLPLPEWRYFYRFLVDLGADLVIASHPHVIQGKEEYKGKFIYYSLGNFFFNMEKKDPRWRQAMTVTCELSKDENGKKINCRESFFKEEGNKLLPDDSEKSLKQFKLLSEKLSAESFDKYLIEINQVCLNAWHKYYRSYYTLPPVPNGRYSKLPGPAKKLVNFIAGKYFKPGDEVLLYHNISIETHRFVVERALRQVHGII